MTSLVKMSMFQGHNTPLLFIADLVRVGAVVVPVLSKCPTILATMPLGLAGKLLESGR